MSELMAARFCTEQLLKGNWKAWRFLLRKWWRGIRTTVCERCGNKKGRTLSAFCSRCKFTNLMNAIFDPAPRPR